MPCPYFYPLEMLDGTRWPNPPHLPLGDPHAGVCRANAAGERIPSEISLRDLCNQGYARSSCAEFPAGDGPDAVRFGIASDSGGTVRVLFVIERDHLPYRQGAIDYPTQKVEDEILRKQADAYVASYLRRKTRARN